MSTHEEKKITAAERSLAKQKMLQIGDDKTCRDIYHMFKSRFKILYVCTPEEVRVIEFFKLLAVYEGVGLYQWDIGRGLLDGISKEKAVAEGSEVHENPVALLAHILDRARSDFSKIVKKKFAPTDGSVFLLLDFHRFFSSPEHGQEGMPIIERHLKEFSQVISGTMIVIVAPDLLCPPTLTKEITVVDFPFPSKDEVRTCLNNLISDPNLNTRHPTAVQEAKDREEELIKAVSGLTLVEAENAFAKSLVKSKRFDIITIMDEKRQVIRKTGILEYRHPRFTMDNIGGLDELKQWAVLHKLAFQDDARDYGLPVVRGLLLIGIPGSGKSLFCEALASAYEMPLLRMDMGAIFSSHIGASERNIRQSLQTAEVLAPTIFWIDEIDKGLRHQNSGETDGGTSSRVFATFLTWLQDKEKPVFVVCTANDVLGIPPEFMRAGRFDEIFFLDIPDYEQRCDVIQRLLIKKKRDPVQFDMDMIANKTVNYTPVEIEKAIDIALFYGYSEGKRPITTDDILKASSSVTPLYNSRKEEIEAIREWAKGRARRANSVISKRCVSHKIEEQTRSAILDLEL